MTKFTRRTIAVVLAAVTIGTGSAVAATSAASAAPDTSGASRCFGSNLEVWVAANLRSTINGVDRYHLEFTNAGRRACTLNGFPSVIAVTPGGRQLGAWARHSGGVPATTITLAPGATAHSIFGYNPVQVIPACKPARPGRLKVFAPGVALSRRAFFPSRVCTTGRIYMYTWRLQPGL